MLRRSFFTRTTALRMLLSVLPLLMGSAMALGIVVLIINWQGTVLDATVTAITVDTETEAEQVIDRLRAGESFETIADDLGERAPFARTITPETSRLPQAGVEAIFTPEAAGSIVGPFEVRRGWYVAHVQGITAVDSSNVFDLIYKETLATAQNRANVIDFWLPILLCSLGLVLTFTAGLWNIGIEGQVGMGAVGATSIALFIDLPRTQLIATELLVAAAAGAAWALLAAILRTRGGVNEIFGGVALNFIASNFSTFLLVGPWKPPTSSGSATESFPAPALLPTLGEYRLSSVTLAIAITAFGLIFLMLSGSRWGLQLKAMGRNQPSAEVLGVPTERNIWLSMALCGALAGVAGAHLVLFRRGNLPANASGGIGFLALLVVLLVSIRVTWVPLVALVFSGLMVGALPLRTRLSLDASLIGVMIGVLVFAVFLFEGVRLRILEHWQRRQLPADDGEPPTPDYTPVVAADPPHGGTD